MALTYKEAEQTIAKLYQKFNSFAEPIGMLTGLAIGCHDMNKAKKILAEHQKNNDIEGYHLKNIFTINCMSETSLTQDQKNELTDDCAKILGRSVDQTDINFMGGLKITLH